MDDVMLLAEPGPDPVAAADTMRVTLCVVSSRLTPGVREADAAERRAHRAVRRTVTALHRQAAGPVRDPRWSPTRLLLLKHARQ